MTLEEAKRIVGNQPRQFIKNMVRALELHPWLNDPIDKLRLKAGKRVLRG